MPPKSTQIASDEAPLYPFPSYTTLLEPEDTHTPKGESNPGGGVTLTFKKVVELKELKTHL